MRKANLTKNHDWFEQQIDLHRAFLDRTIGTPRVIQEWNDKFEIIEGSVLRICALWESFIIEELIDCLNLDCSTLSGHLKLNLPKDMSKDMCEAVLIGDRYLDFKSVKDLQGFARKVLCKENNPFDLIEDQTAKKIDDIYIIRNYISHLSKKSETKLRQMYKTSYRLSKLSRPGDVLIAHNAHRFYQYIEAFFQSSRQMRGII